MNPYWHLRPRACFLCIDTSRYSHLCSVHSAIRELHWFMMSPLKKAVLVILSLINTHRTEEERWLQNPPFYSQSILIGGKTKRDKMTRLSWRSCSCGCRDLPASKRNQSALTMEHIACIYVHKAEGKGRMVHVSYLLRKSCPDALADRSRFKCWDD